jgi:uncharacterized protein YqjF (DUF2071 family)
VVPTVDDGAQRSELVPSAPSIVPTGHAEPVTRDREPDSGRDAFSARCPFTVEHPIMAHRWERLTFLHWSFEPSTVQELLPDWLEVETFDDAAWVGVVPFFMRVGTARGRRLPWMSNFCETNVRTYVRDYEGRSGIWFFSLDAARLGAVLTARTTYRLPYFWSRMCLEERDDDMAYTCTRRWPDRQTVTSRIQVRTGAPFAAADLSDRDHFLTARWVLFSAAGGRRSFARAFHSPWPLHRAEPIAFDDFLITMAGLPSRQGQQPIVHYSPGVDVRIGRPEHYLSQA